MKFLLFGVSLGLLFVQGPPPEAYPGQRDHAEPPKDWFCVVKPPKGQEAHACACKRMQEATKEDPDCCNAPPAPEDQKCLVFCHKDHCHCPTGCKIIEKGHHHAAVR